MPEIARYFQAVSRLYLSTILKQGQDFALQYYATSVIEQKTRQ
jgi:hypothetical protein